MKLTLSARRLEDPRPARADRAQRFKNSRDQFRRSLEITQVASHADPSSPPVAGAGTAPIT